MKPILLLLASAVLLFAGDVTGTWDFQVESDIGTGTPTFKFKQDGKALSGTYSGQLGEAPLKGTVDGTKVEFSFEVSPSGDKLAVKYVGALDGDMKMSGTVDFGGQAKGKFSGTKK